MPKSGSRVKMVGGFEYALEIGPDELDAEIIEVLGGESNGVVDGWRFVYVNDSRGNSLRLNVDHIAVVEEGRSGVATF